MEKKVRMKRIVGREREAVKVVVKVKFCLKERKKC